MKRIAYLLMLVLAVALTGCRSSRTGTTSGALENREARSRYDAFVSRPFDFEFLQSKVKYSLGGKNLNGKLNVELGKRLCMTMTVIGAEVARVEADQETVFITEKLDKVYAQLSIEEMSAKLGMQDEACYEALEALLLGRIFIPGKGIATKADFGLLDWSTSAEGDGVVGTYQGKKYLLRYTLDGNGELSETQVEVEENGATFTWSYVSHQLMDDRVSLPTTEKLQAVLSDKDISLQLSINNPQSNKKGWNSFNPNGYRQVTLEELLTIVKNLK